MARHFRAANRTNAWVPSMPVGDSPVLLGPFGILALFLAVLVVVGFSSAPAHAQGFGCGSYLWGSPYPADLTSLYRVGAIPTPPYFALHPPVYYDMPVPRTYGYGPWAYPPYVSTPEIVEPEPEPEIIQNKYVPRSAAPDLQKPKTAKAPLRIQNPYVIDAEGTADAAFAVK